MVVRVGRFMVRLFACLTEPQPCQARARACWPVIGTLKSVLLAGRHGRWEGGTLSVASVSGIFSELHKHVLFPCDSVWASSTILCVAAHLDGLSGPC